MQRQTISSYKFKHHDWKKYRDCHSEAATTDIFLDLVHHNLIPDPFVDDNEAKVQWVGEKDWIYKTNFTLPSHLNHRLKFHGLDTFAQVFLDGELILSSENQFHINTVDITDIASNAAAKHVFELTIVFKSAMKMGQKLSKKHGELVASNGDYSRVYVRKAQYHYGWDWGPKLMTCGIFRPIEVESYSEYWIESIKVTPVPVSAENWSITAELTIIEPSDQDWLLLESPRVQIDLLDPSGNLISSQTTSSSKACFALKNPQLWYPRGYGAQAQYSVKAHLNGTKTQLFALRTAKLMQEPYPDGPGASFYFEINQIPVFCGGSNWIPCDSFYGRVTENRISTWLELAANGNHTMIRVWGGGYYESDHFYNECDRLGLVVFQDFLFACAQYPCFPEFKQSVTKEIEDQLNRLRHHPSIIHYSGNNEDYFFAEELNFESNFPARELYENVMPSKIKEICYGVSYTPGSPYGGDTPNSTIEGDMHQWDIWHGTQQKYQNWPKLLARFLSEFGLEAFPDPRTLQSVISNKIDSQQSPLVEFHNKAGGFERRIASYLMENVNVCNANYERWCYLTQLIQSECLCFAYKAARRQWRDRKCGGALVWQLNDCWPVVSWSIVDYYQRPKMGYYTMKRELTSLAVGMIRKEVLAGTEEEPEELIDTTHDFRPKEYLLEVWIASGKTASIPATAIIEEFTRTGQLVSKKVISFVSTPNSVTDICHKKVRIDSIFCTKLLVAGQIVHRAYDWPQPLKKYDIQKGYVQYRAFTNYLMVSVTRPIKGVFFRVEREGVDIEDNGFDLCPGDLRVIKASGLKVSDVLTVERY